MKTGNAVTLIGTGAIIALLCMYAAKKMNERRETTAERITRHPLAKIGVSLVTAAGSVWFAHFLKS